MKVIDAQQSIIAVMAALEKWEIALGPDFHAFKRAFSDHGSDIQSAFSDLMQLATPYLPPTQYPPPDEAMHEKLEKALTRAWLSGLAWTSDLWDLRIALQNRLLGGLFEWRVPPRTPGDPTIKATVLADTPVEG